MPRGSLPDLSVRVNSAALPVAARADLRSVTVQEDLQVLSMFTLELHNWNDKLLRVSWSDSPLFAVGNQVEIWLGYVGDLHKVMLAEVTSLEPVFSAESPSVLMVRGYDYRQRLARGRKTRTFAQMKDSAIADQVAREAGLRSQVQDTKVTHGYVIQSNQSDWEFLLRRASLIGYEMYVRDKVLYFRPPQSAAQPARTLSLGQDITEFSPRLSSLTQDSEVAVRSWNVKEKKAVIAAERAGRAVGRRDRAPGVRNLQPDHYRPAGPGRRRSRPVAAGQFNAMSLAYVEGDVVAFGQPRLRAGTVVNITGAGRTFSCRYYVTSVTHTLTLEQGYQTSFTVQRNAV